MIRVEPWKIYSWWVFAMVALWLAGLLPFSPLASAVLAFIGSVIFATRTRAGAFILLMHAVPLWLLRHEPLDLAPNALVYLAYVLVLASQGTDPLKIYKIIFENPPATIGEYMCQRGLKTQSCG